MSILAQRSGSATSRPAGGVSTHSRHQVQGGGADDQGRVAPAAPDDHRPGRRANSRSQEPLGRLPSRSPRRPSHHPHVRQAVRPYRAGPPEDRPSSNRPRRAQGGQLMRGAVYKRGSTWTWHFDIDPDPLTGRRRQRTKGGYQTKKAAEQALAEAIGQWRTGRLPQSARPPPPHPLPAARVAAGGEATTAPLHLGQLPHLHRRLRRADPRPGQASGAHPRAAQPPLRPPAGAWPPDRKSTLL